MKSYSLEQLEVLMFVATADEPLTTAVMAHRRWRYILTVAQGALEGHTMDSSLPQVIERPQEYQARAEAVLAVLNEWLHDHGNQAGPGFAAVDRPDQSEEATP